MKQPVLVVMAAGMGSRYGGLKQIDPVDEKGHIIMDFSIYDAMRAGFKKVIFIIKKENEALFREAIGDRVARRMEVEYVFQDLYNLPEGFSVPEGRVKPWGTGHAILSCLDSIDGPFTAINADDYYGVKAFQLAYDFLTREEDESEKYRFMMVGYQLKNTLTDFGHVSRGICETDENGMLKKIVERTHIEKKENGVFFTEDEGASWTELSPECTVSMNMWGFSESLLGELKKQFTAFLKESLPVNPLKCEYYLPFAVNDLLREGKATAQVLRTHDRWFGMTYREDRPMVTKALKALQEQGFYPERF